MAGEHSTITTLAPPFSAFPSQFTQSRTPRVDALDLGDIDDRGPAAELFAQRAELVVLVDDSRELDVRDVFPGVDRSLELWIHDRRHLKTGLLKSKSR